MTVFRHRITGNGAAGDIWICTLHSESSLPLGSVHAQYVSAITGFLNGTMKALWNTHTSTTEAFTDQLDPSTGHNVAQAVDPVVVAGTGTGGSVAQGTALVMSWITGLPTRKGRGRMFLPSPDDGHITTAGIYVQADCATVADGGKAFLAALNPVTQAVLYNRLDHSTTNILNARVNSKPSFQRRRNNKVSNDYSVGV
jgi:hypothetical protein